MGAMDPLDPLALDASLSDEERGIRDAAREWVNRRILPEIEDWYEAGQIPAREIAKELGALGFLGMHLQGYGCLGANAVSYGLAATELEAGDSGLRSFVSVQGSLAMFAILTYGSDAHKDEWLPRMAAGEAIGCFGLSEPDAGSDPNRMRTAARRDGDDWIVTGTKMWITNGSVADVSVVWAHTDDGVRGFLVPAGAPGFRATDVHRKMSLRASVTSELVLDDVRLPASAMLPGAAGLKAPLSCLNEARYGIVWGVMGAARACFATALDYAGTREQFDRPIASLPAHAEEARGHGVGAQQGTAAGAAPGPDEGRGAPASRARQLRQAQQHARSAGDRPDLAVDPRRERHHAGVPDHAPHDEPRVGPHLRGDRGDPHAGGRAAR